MRGRKNPNKPPPSNILPPCRVCGEAGTGFHYGVTACGACKGFFRRSLTREEPYECSKCQRCDVGPSTKRRKSCPKCRYDKCVAVGMCKEACKVGRYSRAKKSKDIKQAIIETNPASSPPLVSPTKENGTKGQSHQSQADSAAHTTSETYQDIYGLEDYAHSSSSSVNFLYDTEQSLSTDEEESFEPSRRTDSYHESLEVSNVVPGLDSAVGGNADNSLLTNPPVSTSTDVCSTYIHPISSTVVDSTGFFHPIDGTIGQATSCMGYGINSENDTLNSILQSNNDSHRPPSYTTNDKSDKAPSYITLKTPTSSTNHPITDHFHVASSTSLPTTTFKGDDGNQNECSPLHDSTNTSIAASWGVGLQTPTHINSMPTINSLSSHTLTTDLPHYLHDTHIPQFPVNTSSQTVLPQNSTPAIENNVSSPHLSSPLCPAKCDFTAQSTIIDNTIRPEQPAYTFGVNSFNSPKPSHFFNPTCNSNLDREMPKGHQTQVSKLESSLDPVSTSSKRHLQEREEHDQPATKKRGVLDSVTSHSSRQFLSKKSNTLVPFLKEDAEEKSKPFILCVVAPDPMKYVLSIFDQFPYHCFEKQSIAPLLKLCYDTHDWIDDCCPKITLQKKKTAMANGEVTPDFQIKSIFTYAQSPENPTSTQDSSSDILEMDSLFDFVQTTHAHYYGSESAYLSATEAKKYVNMFHKICQLQDSLKGTLDLVDDEKYFTVLKSTGLDVDRRREYFQCVSQNFDKHFMRDAEFYRSLPGFRSLSLNDRIHLIKSTFLVVKSLAMPANLDVENDVYIEEERCRAVRISTIMRVSGLSSMSSAFTKLTQQLIGLDITHNERVLLKAFFIFCTDFCDDLGNPKLVAKWNDIYLKCLHHHVRKTHGANADDRINKIQRLIATLKGLRGDVMASRRTMSNTLKHLLNQQTPLLIKEVLVD